MGLSSIRCLVVVLTSVIALSSPAFGDNMFDDDKFDDDLHIPAAVLLSQAHEHLSSGDTASAIQKLEAADRLAGGRSVDALLLLAIAQNSAGDPKKAIEAAKRALELDPDGNQAADVYFQIGLAELNSAAPDEGGQWSRRSLRRAESALREAVRLDGPRVLEAKAHLAYVVVLRENQKSKPSKAGYDEGLSLARERYEDGSPGSGMALARQVLCGSPTCEPFAPPGERADQDPESEDSSTKGPVLPPKKLTPGSVPGMDHARRYGVRGRIVIQAMVTVEGRLADIRIVEGLPFGLNEMVVDELRRRRFEPATQDGKPVEVNYSATFTYH